MNDLTNYNLNKITDYFKSGCKENQKDFYFGLELEHFIIDKNTFESVQYYGENGVENILQQLKVFYDSTIVSNGHIIGLKGKDDILTLEPAAQLEISINPKKSIEEVKKIYDLFLNRVNSILEKYNYELVNLGYHPKSEVDNLPLLPKDRYKFMDSYFKSTGICGKNMMKGSASTQVSIDYLNESDFIKKFRTACVLGPLLALLTDNSPIFEGQLYNKNLLRQYIWKNVDNDRSGIVNIFDDVDFGFKRYAQYIYNVPIIAAIEKDGTLFTTKSSYEYFKERKMTDSDIENVISMVFPDVRLKKFIEIRIADSLPQEYALAYLALIKGLFINIDITYNFITSLGNIKKADIELGKISIINLGYNGTIYNKKAFELIDQILDIAYKNLNELDKKYLQLLIELANNKVTLSQIHKSKLNLKEGQK